MKENARRTQENDFQIAFFSGILVPFFLYLLAPAVNLLHLVDNEDPFLVTVDIHLHPGFLPMVGNPGGVEAVYPVCSEIIIWGVNAVAELIHDG